MIRCCRSRALEGWIVDHSVEFLVDSGSSVTVRDSPYQTLIRTGAPVGALGYTSRTLRGANGTGIGVSECSHCVVSFMGLQTEFPILVGAGESVGIYRRSFPYSFAILRPELMPSLELMFWAPCCHIPWTLRMASCLQRGVLHSSYTDGILLFPVVFLQWATARYHLMQRLCCTVLYGLPVVVRCHPVIY